MNLPETYGTFSTAYVEAMRLRLSALEPENKDLRDRFSDADTERNAAQAALKAAFARVAELEAENKDLRNRAELADGDVKRAQAILDNSNTYIRRIEVKLQSESQAKIDAEFHVVALKERLAETDARCKRLEDAALEVYLDCIASDHLWSEKETRNMHALRDVLEAKP